MANYLISGVWKDSNHRITYVLLHLHTNSSFAYGEKKSVAEVVQLIKSGNTISTVVWPYNSQVWRIGARVEHVHTLHGDYIRTHKDATIMDNLDNLIRMEAIH